MKLQNDLMTNTAIIRNIRDNELAKEFLISTRGVRAVQTYPTRQYMGEAAQKSRKAWLNIWIIAESYR